MTQIIEIQDLNLPELEVYSQLNEAQLRHYYEPNGGLFIAESFKVIIRAIEAGYEPISMLITDRSVEKILEQFPDLTIPVYAAPMDVLKTITGFHLTEGLLCALKRRQLPSASDICKNASRIAVLEDVENPTNIGAIFRSAAALGIDGVLLTPGCCDPLYRRTIRVSMGNVFLIPWTYLTSSAKEWSERGTDMLRELGFKTVSMALREDTIDLNDPLLEQEERLAIFLGNETNGLTDQTIMSSDYRVKIPMTEGVDSLNVAAASAVAFWELGMKYKQRR